MARVSTRRALEYAISPPILRLLAVVVLGWVLLPFGLGLLSVGPFARFGGFSIFVFLQWLVGLVASLVGLLALYGGLVALLYKIVVDAVGDAGALR